MLTSDCTERLLGWRTGSDRREVKPITLLAVMGRAMRLAPRARVPSWPGEKHSLHLRGRRYDCSQILYRHQKQNNSCRRSPDTELYADHISSRQLLNRFYLNPHPDAASDIQMLLNRTFDDHLLADLELATFPLECITDAEEAALNG